MHKFRHFVGTLSSLLGLAACGSGSSTADSELKLTNAIAIDEGQFPAVVLLYRPRGPEASYCTGTFINDHQVLTAAHCVNAAEGEAAELFFVRPETRGQGEPSFAIQARAIRTHIHPEYTADSQRKISPFDLAIVDFPGGTAPASLKVGTAGSHVNDKVTLVGYGVQELATNGRQGARLIGDKRYGSNTVKSCEKGLMSLAGLARDRGNFPLGQHVASGEGDSGSPWIKDGEVTSMTVGGEIQQMAQGKELGLSYAVDLNSTSSRAFLEAVMD